MTSEPHMNGKNASSDLIWEQAVQWVLRQRDDSMDASDWQAFTTWLEQSPNHAAIYDQALEADVDLGALGTEISVNDPPVEELQAANDNRPWWAAFGAIAAVLLAAIVLWPGQVNPEFATLQTEPGEIREVAIGSNVVMTVNGNSQLAVNETDHIVRMIDGEASFAVTSGAPGAIRVEVENLVLIDVGTVFNVIRYQNNLRLAVTEGAVMINPDDQQILVKAGNEITMTLDDLSYASRSISDDNVLAWQQQQLIFENRSVASVIADVERNLMVRISIPGNLAEQQITGTLNLANDQEVVMNDLAAVLGKTARQEGDRWTIAD